ncbi:putative membrane protein YkoI [Cryobacterium sp. MP_3.1]|uniref:PepSY domain-containing protein n=1 Tax=Cryobacterium sp. MP_3.1 TaxID=3071711 RepID=UPI002DFFDBD8|nr:putative membrane protein YkoI [Cryobacterium sp. MP_3.1]
MKKKTIWITGAAVAAVLVVGGAGLAIADPFDSDGPLTGSALDKASAAALDAVGSGTVTDTETADDNDAHAYEVEVTLADGTDVDVALDEKFAVLWVDGLPADGTTSVPGTGSGSGSGSGSGDGDDDGRSDDTGSDDSVADDTGTDDSTTVTPLTDADRDAASAAALATLPAGTVGTVTEVERSDDFDHAYEVEITLENGQDVDVELDAAFAVLKVDGAPTA